MEFVQPIREKRQIDTMKKVLKGGGNGLRDHCLFTLGVNSGLRVSDLLGLAIEDVMDSKGKVRDRISLREHKTGKNKDFPLGPNAKKSIQEYLVSRKGYSPDEPLFISRKKRALSRGQVWTILNNAAQAVGIKENIGTHTLRKTFGYHLYLAGTDITRIQKLMNHSAPSITLAYIGITQDELDNVYLSLDL